MKNMGWNHITNLSSIASQILLQVSNVTLFCITCSGTTEDPSECKDAVQLKALLRNVQLVGTE